MGVEIPVGGEDSPTKPETAPSSPDDVQKNEQPSNKKNLYFLSMMILCGIALALIIALVPEWGKKEEIKPENKTKPFAKVFDPVLPVFSEKVTEGYDTVADLENDLRKFGFMTLNQEINGYFIGGGWGCGGWGRPWMGGPGIVEEDTAMDVDMGMPVMSPSNGGSANKNQNVFDGVSDFGTNNQEDSIDTADLAKSDGTFIYTSYGDYLVVTNVADGKIMSKVQLPKIDIQKPEDEKMLSGPYGYYYSWTPTPSIQAILLEGDNLALVVSGYGAEYESKLSEQAPICNYMGTRIMVYDINGGDPKLMRQQDIHGFFKQAYSTNGVGHVVTEASIDTWTHLREPIQRWKFEGLSDEEYEAEAIKISQEQVPIFAAKLAKVLGNVDLTRLSLFVNSIEDEETLDGIMSQLRIADAVSMVGSFKITDDTASASTELEVSLAGTTQPGNWGYVYANDNMIIVADQGYEWVEEKQEYAQSTFLVGFRLDGASAKHEVVGSVFGAPLNPYSLDMVEKNGALQVRIATTITFWSGFMVSDGGGDMVDSWIGSSNMSPPARDDTSNTWNEIVVLGTSGPNGSLLEKKSGVRLGKPNERFTAVRFLDDIAYAVTFERIDPLYTVDLSNPNNIKILGELEVTGFSEYLHPIEGGKILAIGQETDDAGSIIGLQISLFGASDPSKLTLINRLQMLNEENGSTSSGASWEPRAFRYFTVNDLGILIIPVTKYSWNREPFVPTIDETAGESAPSKGEAGASAPSDGGIALEKDMAIDAPMIAPDEWYVPAQQFEGFEIFTVENDVISSYFSIDHFNFNNPGNDVCNSWCADLPERSFVVDGDLITMKGQSVVSTNLNTQRVEWFNNMRQAVCCST